MSLIMYYIYIYILNQCIVELKMFFYHRHIIPGLDQIYFIFATLGIDLRIEFFGYTKSKYAANFLHGYFGSILRLFGYRNFKKLIQIKFMTFVIEFRVFQQ